MGDLKSLKRKYNSLLTAATDLVEQTHRLKRQKLAWKQEKQILLDKICGLAEKVMQERSEEQAKEPDTTDIKSKPRRRSRSRRHKQSEAMCAMEQSGRQCKMKALVGCKYCWHHAAFDPDSEYQFCAHTDPSGKRCQVSVLKSSKLQFCQNHKKKYGADGKYLGDGDTPAKKTKKSPEASANPDSTTSPSVSTPSKLASSAGNPRAASGGNPLSASTLPSHDPMTLSAFAQGFPQPPNISHLMRNKLGMVTNPMTTPTQSPLSYMANARAAQAFLSAAGRIPPYMNHMGMSHVYGYPPQ